MAATGDRSLGWEAYIDLSRLKVDAKNAEQILNALGASVVDSTQLDNAIKKAGQTAKQQQQEVADTVKALNQSLISEALKTGQTIKKNGITTILPEGFVSQEKAKIEQVVDFTKNEIQQLQEVINKYGISAIQTQGKNIPRPTGSAAGSRDVNSIVGEQLQATLQQAQAGFQKLDDQTKQYVLDLVDMQTALAQVENAQKKLSSAFNAGKVDQTEYAQATAALKKAQDEIKASIANLNTVEQTSLAISDLQTNTLNEKKAAVKALQLAYGNLTEAEQTDEAIGGKMKSQIIDLTARIKEQSATVQKASGIITEYRQLRNKIASDQANGIFNQEDLARATQLEHSIQNVNRAIKLSASNTAGIDALSQGVQGLVGAFTAASGVIGLFTDDNEKAQQVIRVTTSAMSTLMGVQQLAQVLNKDSAVNIYVRNLLAKNAAIKANTISLEANNVATIENAAAEGVSMTAKEAETAATVGATAAQWSLNAAMEANPVGVVLIAITAIIGAFALFTTGADKATKAQERLNDVLKKSADYLNQVSSLQKSISDDRVNTAQRSLDLAKAEGKSRGEILKLQQNVNDLTKQGALEQLKINGVDPSKDIYVQVLKARQEAAKATAKATDYFNQNTKDLTNKNLTVDKEAAQKDQKILDDHANFLNEKADKLNQYYNEYINTQSKGETDIAAFNKESSERALASDTDYWKGKVEIAKQGTKEWLEAQLKLNSAAYNKTVSTPGATSGQISLASATKQKADLEAQRTYNNQVLKDQQDQISAQLANVKQGSAEELNLKLQLLEKQKLAEINNAKENAAAIERINADSQKKQDELKKTYAKAELDRLRDLQLDIAKINLNEAAPDSESALAWTKDIANKTALKQIGDEVAKAALSNPAIKPDVISAASTLGEDQVKDFAEKVKKIDENLGIEIERIWSETNEKNLQSDNSFINNLLQNKNRIVDIKTDIAKETNNAILNNPNSDQYQVARANVSNNQLDQNRQLEYLNNLKDTYKSVSGEIGKYFDEVQGDFKKIGDLSKPDSDIRHALDGLKDPRAKQSLTEILNLLHSLGLAEKDLKKQEAQALLGNFGDLGNSISQISGEIGDMNKELAQTLQTLGSMISAASEFGKALISQNPVQIFSGAVGLLGSILSANARIRQQQAEYKAEAKKYQQDLILGQIQYNQYIIQHRDIQDAIVRGMREELKLRIQLNNEAVQATEDQLAALTKILQKEGQQITGTKTTGIGFIGTEKTKNILGPLGITDDMSVDQIADLLRALSPSPKLTSETKAYVDQWLALYDAIQDANKEAEQFKEQLAETFSGTTANNIAQSIVDGLKAGKRSFEDFADDINALLSNSIFASIKETLLNGAVKDVWQKFYDYANDPNGTGQLTPDQIAELQASMQAAITQGANLLDQAKLAFPDLENTLNQTQGLTGQIKGITQDQASELAGLYRNGLDVNKRTLSEIQQSKVLISQQITFLSKIEKNTRDTADNLTITNKKLDQVISNTKTPSLRDLGS